MATASWRSALLLAVTLLGACSRGSSPSRPPAAEAASPDAAAVAAPVVSEASPPPPAGAGPSASAPASPPPASADPADAGTAPVPPAPLSAAVAVVGGRDVPIEPDGSTLVDAGASFRVEFAVPLADGRLALHDEQDAMVASSGTSEVGASWTRYRLVPEEPLRPGSAYALRVDGAATREVHDPGGRAYAPLVLKLKTGGERPPTAPARKKRGKRRP